jgi:S-adenosylmethionine:tRNA ribosyltransferase-isomerase
VKPATWPRAQPLDERMLVIDPARAALADLHVSDLPALLAPGDALIVNDAATLPASFHAHDGAVEVRLLGHGPEHGAYRAVLFGAGDYRTPTEQRAPAPVLHVGDRLELGATLAARITAVDPSLPRLIELRFEQDGAALYQALYRHGRPIQYAYVHEPLALFHVQSRFAGKPWAFEAPSAGRPLTFGALRAALERGVHLGRVTHAAGISSIGSDAHDARLPFPERYAIDDSAVRAVAAARRDGGRVIAVGTTVVRALESSAAEHGALRAGAGQARLVLGPAHALRVADGIFTGMHARGTSHFALLSAFAPSALLERADDHAEREGYLGHELGDSCLLLAHALRHRAEARDLGPPRLELEAAVERLYERHRVAQRSDVGQRASFGDARIR